ncbi:transposase IS3/IS911 family protein [Candidatus Protofrankia datiscae]|uniref:Transposase IS3/IS911 family protein n=1 Tax=Candidatus Protofrankia datiscae TaxID=2716812 RepID=F8B333_9ACTN|nr:transposase IS3/IS911 family protein [Candidatus Protofrankia datiscae]
MGSARRKFTQEYKSEAVRLVLDSGRSVTEVAKSLGIHETTLGNWVKKAKENGETEERPLSVSERAELEELRKKYAQAQMDIAFLKKSGELLRERAEVKFEFISIHAPKKPVSADGANTFPVDYMCKKLDVSRQGYYAWKKRGPSRREKDDATLSTMIRAVFDRHEGRYGVRRIFHEIRRQGVAVAYKRVQRLMATMGLVSVHPRPRRPVTTVQAADSSSLPDLVGQDFAASAPNQLWYGDITYIRTWDGWVYMASVIDAFSRKIVGWAVADHIRTELVLDALRMAVTRRRPPGGVIFHADRGGQYTSREFVAFCRDNNVRNSVGRTGICFDNAAAESFWATLKKEFVHLHPFDTIDRVRAGIFEYVEIYYNRQRLHSSIGYLTPVEFEEEFDGQTLRAA